MSERPADLRRDVLSVIGSVAVPSDAPRSIINEADATLAPQWTGVERVAGGFSGAAVFRVTSSSGQSVVAKRWPLGTDATRLAALHRITETLIDSGFDCLARPARRISDQASVFLPTKPTVGRHLWHVEACRPGRADFWQSPSVERARSVGQLIAQLHRRLAVITDEHPRFRVDTGRKPSLFAERLDRLKQLPSAVDFPEGPLQSLSKLPSALLSIERNLTGIAEELMTLAAQSSDTAMQICLRDLWHESVLWSGNDISGLIDLAAARADHPVGDLSRLFGSLFRSDQRLWQAALDAYQSVRPLSVIDHQLLRCLTRSEIVLTTRRWVEWFSVHASSATEEQRQQAWSRLTHYVDRCQHELS